jgi:hypothetical protein
MAIAYVGKCWQRQWLMAIMVHGFVDGNFECEFYKFIST